MSNLSSFIGDVLSGNTFIKAGGVDYASETTTTELNLAERNVFEVDISQLRTLTFTNLLSANRDTTVKLYLTGSFAPEFTNSIIWIKGQPPELSESGITILVFSINGETIYGNKWE